MKTVYFTLWFVITAICSICSYFFCCAPAAKGGAVVSAAAEPTEYAFGLTGKDAFSTECSYGEFLRSDYTLINREAESCYADIEGYLQKHPDQKVVIEGFYAADENNESIYNNLGEARANQVKSVLAKSGLLPATSIETVGKLVENPDAFVNDTLKDGYRMLLLTKQTAEQVAPSIDTTQTITLFFNTGSSQPLLNQSIRDQFAEVISYLESHPKANIMVTGHTDSVGEASNNMVLGQNRANEIKDYLVRNGINANRIQTSSKGESEPVSTVRSENRRVTVQLI